MARKSTKTMLIELVRKYLSGEATEEERAFVEQYYRHFDEKTSRKDEDTSNEMKDREYRLLQEILQKIEGEDPASGRPGPWQQSRRWWQGRIGRAAAVVAVLLLPAALYLSYRHFSDPGSPVPGAELPAMAGNDFLPGENKAVLILEDGSHVVLEEAGEGELSMQGNALIRKVAGGELAYEPAGPLPEKQAQPVYNVLSTPRGGQYRLQLPDGSRVWLNASSSVRYPTVFTGTERVVELQGEAFFEVARDPSRPFRVRVNGEEAVEVLGTKFNVTAYPDEDAVTTALLEGAVKLYPSREGPAKGPVLNAPGQQGTLDLARGSIEVSQVNVESIAAWTQGYFWFDDASVESIMAQISRWYDVEVVFENNRIPAGHINGKISRDMKVSSVLEILRLSGIRFEILSDKIIIK